MNRAKSALSPMRVAAADAVVSATLAVETGGAGFIDLTEQARSFIAQSGAANGVLILFARHTSA